MTRKTLSLLVVLSLVLALFATSALAVKPRVVSNRAGTVKQYGFSDRAKVDQPNDSWDKNSSGASLGAYVSDGNSPGYIIGRSWRDDIAHINPGNLIGIGTDARIHFIYAAQVAEGYNNPDVIARWIHYNMFDPTVTPNGVFVSGAGGIPVNSSPLSEGAHFPQLVLDEDNHAIIAGEAIDAPAGDAWAPWTKLWWDIDPVTWGLWEPDTLPMTRQNSGALRYQQPRIERQEFDGKQILHVISLFEEGYTAGTRALYYHRQENTISNPVGGTWTSMLLSDSVWSNHYDIGVSPGTQGVAAIGWVEWWDNESASGTYIYFMKSLDAGANWTAKVDIEGVDPLVDGWNAWIECNVMVDSEGGAHIVWDAGEYTNGSSGGIDPSKIIHWTDRVAGDFAGGKQSDVDYLRDIVANVDCHGSSNMYNHAKATISECQGRLYVIWQRFGNPDFPDDCAADSVSDGFRGAVNSDLYMNISMGLNGSLWDFRRNLTQSQSPGCDGTDASPCDHDSYPSPTQFGHHSNEFGTTYWGAVPEAFEVKDLISPTYGEDSAFIDVQYVNDILADVARYMDTQHWSNNPIKWFRLPCVDPIVEPRILVETDDMYHPLSWVKSGTADVIDVSIVNVGNDELNVNNITGVEIQGSGWLQINTTSLILDAATSGIATITLNPSTVVTPPGTAIAIEGYVIYESNDPNKPRDSLYINTVITEDVIQVAYDVIRTGKGGTPGAGVPMGPINIGTAGNFPNTGGYMQFYEEDIDSIGFVGIKLDCDSADVYLYDMTPVVMTNASTGWWAPYYSPGSPDTNNFVPIPGTQSTESCASPEMEQFLTGDFVTSDSAIGMNKAWAAPGDDVSFVIERWQIFSRDAISIQGVQLGEYLDVDVPSDSGAENRGSVFEADDYILMSGLETGAVGADETCEQSDGRFYAAGLLGYYYTSEYTADPNVNHTGLAGAYVNIHPTLMDDNYEFVPDSLWEYMSNPSFNADNTEWEDQRAFLAYGAFDIMLGDTLVIWTVHGSLIRATETDVADQIAAAKVWYMANRADIGVCGCCGAYTGGLVGNVDFDEEGKMNLTDITRLIDRVYVSKVELDCEGNGDIAEPLDGKINLADITRLIDRVYVSKTTTTNCL